MNDERVLLCRLCEPHNFGQWTLPGGGLDFGEDPETGCKREVREETGLDVGLQEILTVDFECSEVNPSIAAAESERLHGIRAAEGPAMMQSLRVIYIATVIGGELTDEIGGSTDHAEWVRLDGANKLPLVALAKNALAKWTDR